MTYKNRYRTATFKGVAFKVEALSTEAGRANVVHEYPYRNEATYQDLGKRARQYTIEAYFVGDNFDLDRDALLRVLEDEATAGLLVHPTHGERTVVAVGGNRLSWQRQSPNFETITLTFVEVGNQPSPVPTVATAQLTNALATATNIALGSAAPAVLNTKGSSLVATAAQALGLTQANALQGVVSKVGASVITLGQWTNRLTLFKANLPTLLDDPIQWVASTLNLFGTTPVLLGTAQQAMAVFTRLHAGLAAPNWNFDRSEAPARVQLNTNTATQTTVWRVAALTHASQQAVVVPYTSRDQAIAVRDQLNGLIKTELALLGDAITAPALDEVAQALTQLQASLVADLTTQALGLKRFKTLTLGQTTPALAVAFDLYEDITRADELVAENRIANPNQLPANTPLRVLSA